METLWSIPTSFVEFFAAYAYGNGEVLLGPSSFYGLGMQFQSKGANNLEDRFKGRTAISRKRLVKTLA